MRLVTDSFILLYDAAIGFNVETVQYNNIKFQVWDLGKDLRNFFTGHSWHMFSLDI